ncbi:MAG: GTP-binding protein [Candidatus Helarchaeota archaeon]
MKIIVTGPFHAGKSTFVKSFCGESMNLEKVGIEGPTTVAMDFGSREFQDLRVSVFGTPGKTRFSVVREILSVGADGIVFVVDSANPKLDEETKIIWGEITKHLPDIPMVIAANKQDEPAARSIGQLKRDMPFLEGYKMVPTVAKDNSGLDEAMNYLLKRSIDKILPLLTKLNDYHGQIKGVEKLSESMNKSTTEIRSYLRWLENRYLVQVDWRHHIYWLSTSIKKILDHLK